MARSRSRASGRRGVQSTGRAIFSQGKENGEKRKDGFGTVVPRMKRAARDKGGLSEVGLSPPDRPRPDERIVALPRQRGDEAGAVRRLHSSGASPDRKSTRL